MKSRAPSADIPYHVRSATDRATELGVDWWIQRVAISEEYRCPPPAVRAWPFAEVLEAHIVLDARDAIRAAERARTGPPGGA